MKSSEVRLNQKVKIKNINTGTIQDGCLFTSGMKCYCGKEATITAINQSHKYISLSGQYGINDWSWKAEWFFEEPEDFLSDKDFEI